MVAKAEAGGRNRLGIWAQKIQTVIYRMNKQQDPTVKHIYIGNYIQNPIINQNFLNEKKLYIHIKGFPDDAVVKNLPANAGDTRDVGSIPGLGRSPGVGNGNPLQDSCLGNSMDRGAWQATVHGVAEGQTQLSTAIATYICISESLFYTTEINTTL